MNYKKLLIVVLVVLLITIFSIGIVIIIDSKNKEEKLLDVNVDIYINDEVEIYEDVKEKEPIDNTVDIIDVNSKSRPYAVVVNNTDVAVKVQEGLNRAYLVYEIPTEGNTSRLLALYKDIQDDLVIGTIRSARHNFIDYALESDAIFCCFGWSHYAEKDLKNGSISYLQGLYGGPFYRNNPEGLATEHTAYTSMRKLIDTVNSSGIRNSTDKGSVLSYSTTDVELSKSPNAKLANSVIIPYGAAPQIASFKYNEETKMYIRSENGNICTDHNTKEEVTTKNIIVQKIGYSMCSDNYYWNLNTIGAGEGYYITNGYAVPIIWSKDARDAKTKYVYKNGTVVDGKDVSNQEISVSDGRTWIEVQTTSQNLTIE